MPRDAEILISAFTCKEPKMYLEYRKIILEHISYLDKEILKIYVPSKDANKLYKKVDDDLFSRH